MRRVAHRPRFPVERTLLCLHHDPRAGRRELIAAYHPGMRALVIVGAVFLISCSGTPAAQPSPSVAATRVMALAFNGGLTGTLMEIQVPSRPSEGSPVCGGTISNDPAGANYLLAGPVGADVVNLSFLIHRTQAAGSYAVAAYPDGAASAPAAVNVLIYREEGFAAWSSGTGTLVIDSGGRSGTLSAELPFAGWRRRPAIDAPPPPPTTLPALRLQGSWVCPAGS